MFCYLRIAGVTQANSDGAGLELEAWSVLHGNLLLHGWWATDVSFYTTELPEYIGVTAVAGLRPEVVHICSALTYTLLVLLAAYAARGRARGAEGVMRALLAAGVMLAPQPVGPTQVLLGAPDHVGTGVPVLLLLLLLDWAPSRLSLAGERRPRWYVPVAAGLLLAWSIIGDPLIEVVGAVPLFLASLLRAGRLLWPWPAGNLGTAAAPGAGEAASRPRWTLTLARAWSAAWYELSLAAAAVLAIPLARLANQLIVDHGGFQVAKAWYGLLSLHQIKAGLPMAVRSVFTLFGADYIGVGGAGNVAFALVHLIGVAVVFAAVLLAAWRLVRPAGGRLGGDLVADVALIGLVANFAAFLVEVPKPQIYTAHEIAPMLALGGVLAGRMLGGPVAAAWRRGRHASRERLRRALLPAVAAGLACYAVMLGLAATSAQAPPRNTGMASWLARHHLTSGLAPYWEASSVTVDSGGAVTVLAITDTGRKGHLEPRRWETDVLLAGPRGRSANFVITSPAEAVPQSMVVATFGRPLHSYHYGPYTINTYNKNLLPELAQAAKKKTVKHLAKPAGGPLKPAARTGQP
jgi:hypothetical protein